MTLTEAARRGIQRLSKPGWLSRNAYIRIHITASGKAGPWMDLFDRETQEQFGAVVPSRVLIANEQSDWEEYKGPLDKADDPHNPPKLTIGSGSIQIQKL